MKISLTEGADETILRIAGRFVFETHKDFNQSIKDAADRGKNISINLFQVEYMDSSGLGMLLIARDKAKVIKKDLILTNLGPSVKAILDIANFHKLFTMR